LSGYLVVGKVGAMVFNPVKSKWFTGNEQFIEILIFLIRTRQLYAIL
jgi:hypothetical protein